MDHRFVSGVKASLPACLGVLPVGISIGLLAVRGGLSAGQAVLMSALVMAGSAQLMVLSMLGQGAALPAMVLGTLLINLRHLVMSGAVMQRIRKTSLPGRLLASFALCDESFAIFSLAGDGSHAFLMGSNTALYAAFVASTAAGALMSGFLPPVITDSFGIAFYAAFIGLLLPAVRRDRRLSLLAVFSAGLNFLLQRFLPASWSVILAMVLGALAGALLFPDAAGEAGREAGT